MEKISPDSTIEYRSIVNRPNTLFPLLLFMGGCYVDANPPINISQVITERSTSKLKPSSEGTTNNLLLHVDQTSKSNSKHYRFRDFVNEYSTQKLVGIASKKAVFNKLKSSYNEVGEAELPDFLSLSEMFNQLSSLPIEDLLIEDSYLDSLLFKIKFENDIYLILNIPKSDLTSAMPNAVYTLVDTGDIVASDYLSLNDIVDGVKSHLNS